MIKMHFDGACTPVNPGGIGTWGFQIDFCDGTEPLKGSGICDNGAASTNNIAEYQGLLWGLVELGIREIKDQEIYIFGDSALVVNMVLRKWGYKNPHAKAPHLIPYLKQAWAILSSLQEDGNKIHISWIPRERNQDADDLTKSAYKQYVCNSKK